jgi:hypothetical protein
VEVVIMIRQLTMQVMAIEGEKVRREGAL